MYHTARLFMRALAGGERVRERGSFASEEERRRGGEGQRGTVSPRSKYDIDESIFHSSNDVRNLCVQEQHFDNRHLRCDGLDWRRMQASLPGILHEFCCSSHSKAKYRHRRPELPLLRPRLLQQHALCDPQEGGKGRLGVQALQRMQKRC